MANLTQKYADNLHSKNDSYKLVFFITAYDDNVVNVIQVKGVDVMRVELLIPINKEALATC